MRKAIPIIILTIISAFLIFYRFTDIPKYLAFDEVEFTKLALSLQDKPFTPYSQLATGHSTLYFYILLISLKTFGINIFALRFPAAVFGILSILFFYLIMKKVFKQSSNETMKQWLPFILSLILLSSRWFLNFARFSFEATFLLFLELASIYFLLKFYENQKVKILNFLRFNVFRQKISVSSFYLILSGIFAGLAFLSYTPGRIFFVLPIGFLFLTMKSASVKTMADKQWNNESIKRLLLFLIPFVIIITPLNLYLFKNKDSRIDKLFFWRNHEMTINEKIIGTANNIKSMSLMFFTNGDMNGKHNYPGKPALNPILGLLFVIGLVTTMKSVFVKASTDKQWNNDNNKLFLIYFFLSLFPSLAIYPWENPSMLRTYTVLPSVVYFVSQGIIVILNLFQNQKILASRNKFGVIFFFVLIIFSSFYELRTYFKYQALVFKHSFEIKYPLEKAIKMKNVYEKSL